MTFDTTNIYKLIETPTSQIYRFFNQQVQFGLPAGLPFPPQLPSPVRPVPRPTAAPGQPLVAGAGAIVQFVCNKCGRVHVLQADFDQQ